MPTRYFITPLIYHPAFVYPSVSVCSKRVLSFKSCFLYSSSLSLREFGIRDVHYVDYRVTLVGEIAIRFLSILAQKSIVAYLEFTLRLILAWHHLGGSFHSLSLPPTHSSYLQTPSFISHTICSCSELFKLSPCYS